MSKPKTDVKTGSCSYCGEVQEMEPEHMVPQSTFVNKNKAKIIIDACHDCNHEKGQGEGDLRDYLIIRVGVDGHPDILPLMHEMAESYGRGSSSIGKAADEERRPVIQRRSSGLYRIGYEELVSKMVACSGGAGDRSGDAGSRGSRVPELPLPPSPAGRPARHGGLRR